MLRVPEGGRVENRACDGSANPYLAMAVQLAAGLDGIDRGLDPGEPNRDNLHVLSAGEVASRGIRSLPPTLLHAADELAGDDVLREALGKTPDGDYADYYAKIKREEFHTWHSVVSDWEVERYLTLF
jgi:glutamine synthetase